MEDGTCSNGLIIKDGRQDGDLIRSLGDDANHHTNDGNAVDNQTHGSDLISNLGDDMILKIITDIKMSDLAPTCLLLSKRYTEIWKYVTRLDLKFRKGPNINAYKFISGVLEKHSGLGVTKVDIGCVWEDDKEDTVDGWLRRLSYWKVKDLSLDLMYGEEETYNLPIEYELCPSLYYWDSLESLELSLCNLTIPYAARLLNLKFLKLRNTNLTEMIMSNLTRSCPVLNTIVLEYCNESEKMTLTFTNPSIEVLKIGDSNGGDLMISAPHLKRLELFYSLERKHYSITAPCLEHVSFEHFHLDMFTDDFGSDDWKIKDLMFDLKGVTKQLKLSSYIIQYFTLEELLNVQFKFITPCLVLEVKMTKREMMGTLNLLRSFHKLEKLYIINTGTNAIGVNLFDEELDNINNLDDYGDWEAKNGDFSCNFSMLKMVEIHADFRVPDSGDVHELFQDMGNYLILVEFILKKGFALEEMLIVCTRNLDEIPEEISAFHDSILNMPKAYPDVVINFIWRG